MMEIPTMKAMDVLKQTPIEANGENLETISDKLNYLVENSGGV